MRLLRLLAVLVVCSCRTSGTVRAVDRRPVELAELSLSFPSPGRGELSFALDLENPDSHAGMVRAVWWELWLSGRYFAAGVAVLSRPVPLGGRATLEVSETLVFDRALVLAAEAELPVGLRGKVVVDFARTEQEIPFEIIRQVPSNGVLAPVTAGTER